MARVLVNLPGEDLRKQPSLQFEAVPIRHCIAEEGMAYFFIESLFKFGEEDFSPLILETMGSEFDDEII